MLNLGIPYMGSKRKLASKIINKILEDRPNTKYIYDLFGGGGAVSFCALQYPQIKKVFYNELNTGVCELLRKIQKDGVTPDFYDWIDRETFNKHKNDNTWLGGLIKTCWSFGSNQKNYLLGVDVELIKKKAHEYLMANGYDFTSEKKVKLIKQFKQDKNIIGRFNLDRLQQLEQLQQLNQLEQLDRLKQLDRLEISNLSYEQVQISTPISETVIYLDPPYENTGKYQHDICHRQLEDYFHNSKYLIYLSSYDFIGECVECFRHRSTLSASANNKVVEKLYCNKPVKNNKLFDMMIYADN